MQRLDINGRIRQWEEAKENDKNGLSDLSKHNSDLSLAFVKDFELGINVPKAKKGRRAPGTLLKLRSICIFLNRHFGKKNFEKINKKELHSLFDKMARGEVKKPHGKVYNGTGDFVKNVKTFWGWMIKTKKVTNDITEDLARSDFSNGKPSWVYLTNEQMRELIDVARGDYRALILFLYDSGVRPQEAYRIIVSDFSEDFSELNIPDKRENGDKVSKTFERTIKLMHCSQLLKNYVKQNKLKDSDLLIQINQPAFNKYLRTLSKKLFGTKKTKARGTYDKLKLYDIRHIASIFWLDKYKTNKDLMYRMGWSKEDKIFYYSEFLGRRDKIDDEDMLTKEDKSKYESEINNLKKLFLKFAKGEIVYDTGKDRFYEGKKVLDSSTELKITLD